MRRRTLKSSALLQLRNAFRLLHKAAELQTRDPSSLTGIETIQTVTRRKFLADAGRVTAGIALSDAMSSCRFMGKKSNPEVAIVGAGIAGLHAARILKKAGIIARIYEASPRTGGRIFSVEGMMGDGLWTEMGAEFIDSGHGDIMELAREFNLPLIDRKAGSESALLEFAWFFENRHRTMQDLIKELMPFAETIRNDIFSLSDEIHFENHSPTDARLDGMTITAYLDQVGISGWFRSLIENSFTAEYGMETSEQSALNFLTLFDPGDDQHFDFYGPSDERFSIQGGNQKLTDALSRVLDSQIYKEHRLLELSQTGNGRFEMQFKAGNSTAAITADIVILTLPFTLLREVSIRMPLPEWKKNAIQNVGYGTNSRLFAGVNERIWRRQGYGGYAFSDNGMMNGYDNSQMQRNNSGPGSYTIFLGGKAGVDCGYQDFQTLEQQYVPALNGIFPGFMAQYNQNFQKWHWPSYPFSKGSYLSFRSGQYTTMNGAVSKPVGNLYFAGEHCSDLYQGFMNGGAETGRKVAEALIDKMGGN